MFEPKYGDGKPLMLQSKKNKRWAVVAAAATIFSLAGGQILMGLICAAICAVYVYLYKKAKKREDEAEAFLGRFTDDEDSGDSRLEELGKRVRQSKEQEKKSKQEREQEYSSYLQQIEEDFDLSGLDDDLEDDYDSYEDDEDDGYDF